MLLTSYTPREVARVDLAARVLYGVKLRPNTLITLVVELQHGEATSSAVYSCLAF